MPFTACVARLPVGNIGSPRDMECSALKSQALESIESAIRALKREDGAGWSECVPRRAVTPAGVSVATILTAAVIGAVRRRSEKLLALLTNCRRSSGSRAGVAMFMIMAVSVWHLEYSIYLPGVTR